MANLPETSGATYPAVRQIENGEPQAGGANGLWNEHAKGLIERTNNLKRRLDDLTTRAALEVTVGAGGDFATIGAALSYLSDRRQAYVPGGASVTARLLAGFVMLEQVLVSSVDLSWVTIVSQDPEVTIRRSALVTALSEGAAAYPAFGAQAGGALPRIGCLFTMDGTGAGASRHAYVTRPGSAFGAGAMSARDAAKGFWWSPSNQVLQGVAGTARPISWEISDPDTEANRLNEAGVTTIVRAEGFRLWGNRSTASDPLWAFISVRRTADMIYESTETALLWAMDRPFSAQLLIDIRDSVQAYLDTLIRRGAILGGKAWLDPELNTEATMKAGKLFLDFDIEPPAPLEHLTLQARRNGDYYEELMLSVAGN